jgi:hypothetical protein
MAVFDEVKKELSISNSVGEIKRKLLVRGYLETDIDAVLNNLMVSKSSEASRNNSIFSFKEFIDRIAFGFSSQQFVNILFALSGASLLLIGLVNGLKTILTYIFSGFIKYYSKMKYIGKSIISSSGVLFGLSFLGMTFSVMVKSPILFALSMLFGTFGIIAHGDLYTEFLNSILKNEKRSGFLRIVSYFGILITAASMLLAGYIIDLFPLNGHILTLNMDGMGFDMPVNLRIIGYLLTFEITAILFIISGYILSFIKEKKDVMQAGGASIMASFRLYFQDMAEYSRIFSKNTSVKMLTIAMVLGTIIQILLNSYTGIFIYYNFKDELFKGFMNVAVVFVIALVASILGSMFTKKFYKSLGEAPMLVFGVLLMTVLPAVLYYNPNMYSIGIATAVSVLGASIMGLAQGLIAEKLMNSEELGKYYSTINFYSVIPTVLIVSAGAMIAQFASLQVLFLSLAVMLLLFIMPLYFVIVMISDKEYRKDKALRKGIKTN